jgi:hypothetical protein
VITRAMQSYRPMIAANTTLIFSKDSNLLKFLREMVSTGNAVED